VRTPHIRKCACHILAALARSAAKSSAGRRLRTVAVAVRPKVGAENASSNSTFACEAAVCRRSCSVFTSASAVIKHIAQRGGETVKKEHSMGCATASQPARRTQLQLRHRYTLTAANRAVAGRSPKCCILSPQSSHFRSVSVWGVATAVMIHRAPFKSEIQD
jgi:hypothetical protein